MEGYGEPAALVVCETKSAAPELLTENPVLLTQILNCFLLLLIHPARHADQHEPERIENATHASTLLRASTRQPP
jgi:hypothetical protein